MNPDLRRRLIVACSGGVLAIAAVLAQWFEGTRYAPYRDTGSVWTVCTGHTGAGVVPGRRYSQGECDAFLKADLANAQAGVHRVVHVPLNPWQEAALIDFVFNLGEPALASSTMAAKFNAGDYEGGCAELTKWSKARVHGVLTTLKGLLLRRQAEAELCLMP